MVGFAIMNYPTASGWGIKKEITFISFAPRGRE